jgi:hypothetical protein
MFLLFFLLVPILSFADDAYFISQEAFLVERAVKEAKVLSPPQIPPRAPIARLTQRTKTVKAESIQAPAWILILPTFAPRSFPLAKMLLEK